MIPQKVKDHIEEYISQEVYVQIAIIKGKEKVSTEKAIDKYFNTNHFRDLSEGKPYFHFIHINTSEDYNTSVGVAVRVDKFSDSSIDMYVRCFTKSGSWNNWLDVKERLAIAIKEIVEKNGASFAFPSQSIYVEKK